MRLNDHPDRQIMRLGKLKVALVMRRYRHNRARAIGDHDVVGDPDGYALVIDRVDGVGTGENTRLFAIFQHALDLGFQSRLTNVGVDIRALPRSGDLVHQVMFGRQDHESCAPEGIGPGRENLDGMVADFCAEGSPRAFAAADPVGLHDLDRFRPIQHLEI